MGILCEALLSNDPPIICNAIEDTVNTFILDKKALVEEILANPETTKRFLDLSVYWIRFSAGCYRTGSYDGRNEYSAKVCNTLSDAVFIQKIAEKIGPSQDAFSVALKTLADQDSEYNFYKIHRTLNQQFSSVVFWFLIKLPSNDKKKQQMLSGIEKLFGSHWYLCAYI